MFWAEVNGKELDTTGWINNEAYFADDCTLKGIHRLPLKEALPDQFDLLLYTGDTDHLADSKMQFALSIDKSTVSGLTVAAGAGLHRPLHPRKRRRRHLHGRPHAAHRAHIHLAAQLDAHAQRGCFRR